MHTRTLALSGVLLLAACTADEVGLGDGDKDAGVSGQGGTGGESGSGGSAGGVTGGASGQDTGGGGTGGTGACPPGWADCDNDPSNGCEVDQLNDPNHCGTCDLQCQPGTSCNAGTCTESVDAGPDAPACTGGWADCDGNTANGCETNTASDPNNCGACGTLCSAGQTCGLGECVLPDGGPDVDSGPDAPNCSAGWADCDGNTANGCETNTASDPNNCGACGTLCSAGQTCGLGECVLLPDGGPDADSGPDAPTCSAGWADCDGNTGNGCETDIETDPANCGACGNPCDPGQTCSSGVCSTGTICNGLCAGCELLVDLGTNVYTHGIATDGTDLFFVANASQNTNHSIRKVAKTGGSSVILTSGTGPGFHMVADASNVYWPVLVGGNQYGAIRQISTSGGTPVTLLQGTMMTTVQSFAIGVDSTRVWWMLDVLLSSTPIGGGAINTSVVDGSFPTVLDIAVNEQSVFLTDFDSGRLIRFDKASEQMTVLASGEPGALAVTVDANRVYWALQDSALVRSMPVSGGTATTVGAGTGPIHELAVDETYAYWTDGGDVMRAPKGGGTSEVIASGDICAVDLVVDATHVYFTNGQGGTVVRAPK